jgi:SAM-dependent methyltransferase
VSNQHFVSDTVSVLLRGLGSDVSHSRTQSLADQWATDLAGWAIPQDILDQASEVPWKHCVAMFTVASDIPDSPSHQRAREALEPGGSVLDIGSGGGRASMAITPPAGTLTAVDHQQEMLDEFLKAAQTRGAIAHTFLGDWPDVAYLVPEADVAGSGLPQGSHGQLGPG